MSEQLRVLRLTGEQIGSIEPPPDGDWFVDFDEYEEFVPKRAYDALAAAPSTPEPGIDVEEALGLLNSLGIAGPNIVHAEQGIYPDGKHSEDDTWDGPGWCVCRRPWPCEAQRLADVLARLASNGR